MNEKIRDIIQLNSNILSLKDYLSKQLKSIFNNADISALLNNSDKYISLASDLERSKYFNIDYLVSFVGIILNNISDYSEDKISNVDYSDTYVYKDIIHFRLYVNIHKWDKDYVLDLSKTLRYDKKSDSIIEEYSNTKFK